MLLRKTRETITNTVSQPTKNAMLFSIVALAISIVALLVVAVSHAH